MSNTVHSREAAPQEWPDSSFGLDPGKGSPCGTPVAAPRITATLGNHLDGLHEPTPASNWAD